MSKGLQVLASNDVGGSYEIGMKWPSFGWTIGAVYESIHAILTGDFAFKLYDTYGFPSTLQS